MNRIRIDTRVTVIAVVLGMSGQLFAADLTFENLVENVKSAEALYEDLDIKLTFDHESGPGTLKLTPPEGSGYRPQEKKHSSVWYVSQTGMYRVQLTSKLHFQDKGEEEFEYTKMYDGEMTRVLNDGKIANLRQGYSSDREFIRPHMMLLRRPHYYMPLSVLLSGHDVLVGSPTAAWKPEFSVEYTSHGAGEVDGLDVQMVAVTLLKNDKPQMRIDLALAEQRNFIPARASWSYLHVSKDVPVEESKVIEWIEVESGIWLPKKTHLVSYNPIFMKNGFGRQVQWTERYTVESVSLRPRYDKSVFQNLEVPDGAAVYESIGTDITCSFRNGVQEPLGGSKSRNSVSSIWVSIWVVLWVNVVAFACLTAVFVSRKLLKKMPPDTEP